MALQLNGNWAQTDLIDPYLNFQNTLLDLGVGNRLPATRDVRAWTTDKLTEALANWHTVIESALFYGNAYQIQFVLPHADLRIKELRAELVRRATPQIKAHAPAVTIKGWFDVAEVRAKVDPFDIFAQFLPDMEKAGANFKATCPFHKQRSTGREHTASLFLYPNTGTFHCFACLADGSMFDFVMKYEQLPFAEAVNRVAQLGNL